MEGAHGGDGGTSVHARKSLVETRDELLERLRAVSLGYRSRRDIIQSIRATPPRLVALGAAVVIQIVLMLIALVPQSIWASHGLPDGPVPTALSPVVAGLFYVLPAATGLLSHRWQVAVVLATLPAWLDLGLFAIAAAPRIGPYYLAVEPHAVSTVGILELFAVLGALGWLARPLVFGAAAWLVRVVKP